MQGPNNNATLFLPIVTICVNCLHLVIGLKR